MHVLRFAGKFPHAPNRSDGAPLWVPWAEGSVSRQKPTRRITARGSPRITHITSRQIPGT